MKFLSSQDKKSFVETIILNGPLFYMSTTVILGAHYRDEEGAGLLYKFYMGLLFILGFYPILKKIYYNKLTNKATLPLLIIFVYVGLGYVHIPSDTSFFLYLICFAIPAICVALNIDQDEGLKGIMKWLDVFLPLFAIAFIFMIKNIMIIKLEGEHMAYGQSTSYFSAFCFVIDVFLLRYNHYPKFRIAEKKSYKFLKIVLLPYFVIICLFSGGRGAAVLILIVILYNINVLKKFLSIYFWKFVAAFFLLLIIATIGLYRLSPDYFDLFVSNFDRISALFSDGGINTSASSGRDNIWIDAINLWGESPLLGYGLFSYMNVFYVRPHNIFIEILLQGGLILLVVFCYILIRSVVKYKHMIEMDKGQIFLMPFIIYISTLLMFSSSYWFETFFWFILVYIYRYRFGIINNKSIKYAKH